jgi:hypothetical protein
MKLDLEVLEAGGAARAASLDIKRVLIAGYTGRDRATVLEHIRELEQLGVAPPPRVPMVYEIEPSMLTTADAIQVPGPESSGEVEFYLAVAGGQVFAGVASDHTDRRLETVDVGASKACMPHPVSRQVWRYDDLKGHWDAIEARSWSTDIAGRRLYQEGTLDAFMRVEDLLQELAQAGYKDLDGCLIYGGTIPTLEGFVYGTHFEAELRDPRLDRRLSCAYDVKSSGETNGR